jgi:hypothetical protein
MPPVSASVKVFTVPLAVGVEPVAGHARGVLEMESLWAHQFIK